jgi:hypothetical protein
MHSSNGCSQLLLSMHFLSPRDQLLVHLIPIPGSTQPSCTPAPGHAEKQGWTGPCRYYEGQLRSDDEMLPCATRNVCLRQQPDGRPGTAPPDPKCPGHMHAVYSEAALYTQVGGLEGVGGWLCGRGGGWLGCLAWGRRGGVACYNMLCCTVCTAFDRGV